MTKTIKFFAAAVAGLTATVAIAGEGKQSFTHDGYTYTYTTSVQDGATVIDGQRFPGARPFHYVVKGGKVRGNSGGQPVAFNAAEAKGAARTATVAAAD